MSRKPFSRIRVAVSAAVLGVTLGAPAAVYVAQGEGIWSQQGEGVWAYAGEGVWKK